MHRSALVLLILVGFADTAHARGAFVGAPSTCTYSVGASDCGGPVVGGETEASCSLESDLLLEAGVVSPDTLATSYASIDESRFACDELNQCQYVPDPLQEAIWIQGFSHVGAGSETDSECSATSALSRVDVVANWQFQN